MSKRAIPLDFGNPTELSKFKAKVNLIYEGLRAKKILAPHSVYLHKEDILAALGIKRVGDQLLEDPAVNGIERTGLLVYLTPTNELLNDPDLKEKIFPSAGADVDLNGDSRISLTIVAANDNLEIFGTNGAYLSSLECPPAVDCPPWHNAPPIQ